jgi:hypothetical protein
VILYDPRVIFYNSRLILCDSMARIWGRKASIYYGRLSLQIQE